MARRKGKITMRVFIERKNPGDRTRFNTQAKLGRTLFSHSRDTEHAITLCRISGEDETTGAAWCVTLDREAMVELHARISRALEQEGEPFGHRWGKP